MAQHLYFKGDFEVHVPPQGKFKLRHHGSVVENRLFWQGCDGHEPTSMAIWRELSRRATYIADVGANTGVFALIAASTNPLARILAIEPVASIFSKLQTNVQLNGFDIECIQAAVTDHEGEVTIFDPGGTHSYSASLEQTMLNLPKEKGYSVPAVRLDDAIERANLPRIDLLKIDVERHEPKALLGMMRHLQIDRPSMLIEVLDADVGAQIQQVLEPFNYSMFGIQEGQGMRQCHVLGEDPGNYLICRGEIGRDLDAYVAK